ncbi:MAG TPA: glycoside hydrolase family 25 protein [Lachnospiraceae bacterium]|nr:glycoside hydrolase family 25 protein [Lachnospiraceae bacterium]
MKLPDEYDDSPKLSMTVVKMIIGVTVFMATILILVLIMNRKNHSTQSASPTMASATTDLNLDHGGIGNDEPVKSGTLSPDDFDFWDLYPEDTVETVLAETEVEEKVKNDPATDGKHTLITNSMGEEEWVLISPYLPKNDYDYTKLVCQSNIMKYFIDGKQVSYVGTDLSKYQDYVDFVKLKKAGIDFVMLRVGSRGYGTGQLTIDDYYLDNIKRATDAGLDIGLYFYSQAISADEAVEEANVVLSNIGDYKITYPIAIDMELVANDTCRIENLTREEKTTITKKFLETIKNAGYLPMIYGNKEWLIKKIDLSKLTDYDVWLSQPGDIPDYPYKFTMWQYSTTTNIDGIAGYANMNVSFIDYSEK